MENFGQFDPAVQFAVRSPGMVSYLTRAGFVHNIITVDPAVFRGLVDRKQRGPNAGSPWAGPSRSRMAQVRLVFDGANPGAHVEGEELLGTRVSYFIGADPRRWAAGVPTFGAARFCDLYPGVDVVVRKRRGAIEWDIEAAPGADLSEVRLRIEGGGEAEVDEDGALRIETAAGTLRQSPPVAIVTLPDGERREVFSAYRLVAPDLVAIDVGPVSPGASVLIDPVAAVVYDPMYFSYLTGPPGQPAPGFGHDVAMDIAVTTHGNATIAGTTVAQTFPVTNGAFDTTKSFAFDGFVARFNVAGTDLLWATFIGGDSGIYDTECAYGIEVDSLNNSYVVGFTTNVGTPTTPDFPTTPSAVQPVTVENGPTADGFALKLNNTGTALLYSTLLSGRDEDVALDVAVDPGGNAYVSGYTHSTTCITVFPCTSSSTAPDDYPTTPGAVEENARITQNCQVCLGDTAGFLTKLTPAADAFAYSTFVRCESGDVNETVSWCTAVAVDDRNPDNVRAFVTGEVLPDPNNIGPGPGQTADFPTTPNAFQPAFGGSQSGFPTDAFVAGLDASGGSYAFASYLGGDQGDGGRGIAVSGVGTVWLTGITAAAVPNAENSFPTTPFAPQQTYADLGDAFVVRVKPDAPASQSLQFSSFLGGPNDDMGLDIWSDSAGTTAFVVGRAQENALQNVNNAQTPLFLMFQHGLYDGFVVKIRQDNFVNGSYLGGAGHDEVFGLAVDATGLYFTGWSEGSAFYNNVAGLCPSVTGKQTVNFGGSNETPGGFLPTLPPFNTLDSPNPEMSPFVFKVVKP